ncbi:MAG: FecR domain-containing protein [Burkholderiaceae bacterium]
MIQRSAQALSALVLALGGLQAALAAGAPTIQEPVYVHVTARGDTLIGLGRRLLVDPAAWRELVPLNALRNPDRIPQGTSLRIPLRLMRTETMPATVLNATGQVATAAGTPVAANQALPEGSELVTGADGHATVRLVDGTLLRLRPSSRLQVNESNRLPDVGVTNSAVRLPKGRTEIEAAPAQGGKPGFRIDTPTGLLGVRGTAFRVASDGEGAATRGEVLEGTVGFSGAAPGRPVVPVPQGYGSVIAAGGVVSPPVRLLEAPDLSTLPELQERPLVNFTLPAVPGAAAYRAQVAPKAAPEAVQADVLATSTELRFDGLADGDYTLRVRAVDRQGLEGKDAERAFRLKARPEAPLPSSPEPRAVLFGGHAEFAWTANADAQSYRLQIAGDAGFDKPLRELSELTSTAAAVEALSPGSYRWRLASVRAGNDRGPWGAAREFQMRPAPPAAKAPGVGEQLVSFEWEARPGQRFDFEVAHDPEFKSRIVTQQLAEPRISLPTPAPGVYFVRLRAIESDGFVGPYTSVQRFEVANCLRDSSGACVRAGDRPLTVGP